MQAPVLVTLNHLQFLKQGNKRKVLDNPKNKEGMREKGGVVIQCYLAQVPKNKNQPPKPLFYIIIII